MSVIPRLPDDPEQCQRLLHDLLSRNDELRRQAEDAQRRIDELQHVLDATAADYSQLQEKHAELAEILALLRRYVFGPRRERLHDDPGQGHLFDLHDTVLEIEPSTTAEPDDPGTGDRSRAVRPQRRIS